MLSRRMVLAFGLFLVSTCGRPAHAAELGVRGGLTTSTLSADRWSAGTGFEVGAFGSMRLFEQVDVQPEVLFIRKLARATLSDGDASIDTTLTLDYIEIPVLLKRRLLGGRRRLTPLVFGGLFTAVNTGARSRFTVGDVRLDDHEGSDVKRWDYGLAAGAGIEVVAAGRTWIVDVRYSRGLTAVNGQAERSPRTRSFAVTAGMEF